MNMRKKNYLILLICFFCGGPVYAQGDNSYALKTFYPVPYAKYSKIQLVPQTITETDSCKIGTLYFNSNGQLRICESDESGQGSWLAPVIWTREGNKVFLTNSNNKRIGLGATYPEFRLTLVHDGGIIAQGSVGLGASLVCAGAGSKFIWYPKKAAFRAGVVDGSQWDEGNIGNFSFASGYNTIATGLSAAAFGYGTRANTMSSVAMGYETVAWGNLGAPSVAMGFKSKARKLYSVAMGNQTVADKMLAVAMGNQSIASGDGSYAIGIEAMSTGIGAFAIGYKTQASGKNGTALGYQALAAGEKATAIGTNVSAPGKGSTTFGRGTSATGERSIVIGTGQTAFGKNSFAIGYNAFTRGDESFALGRFVSAEAFRSFVFGQYNITGGDRTSWVLTDPLFVIGNGTAHTSRSNALTVLKNGNVGIKTDAPTSRLHIIGVQEYADNAAALAEGLQDGDFYRTGDELKIVH